MCDIPPYSAANVINSIRVISRRTPHLDAIRHSSKYEAKSKCKQIFFNFSLVRMVTLLVLIPLVLCSVE